MTELRACAGLQGALLWSNLRGQGVLCGRKRPGRNLCPVALPNWHRYRAADETLVGRAMDCCLNAGPKLKRRLEKNARKFHKRRETMR